MTKLRFRVPSPAMVVSIVALIVALGGTSYAAFSLPNGSVTTKALKNKAVTNAKLAPGSVGTAKIGNGAVTASKINTSGLTVPNATALSGIRYAAGATSFMAPGTVGFSQASCPSGTTVVGGGWDGESAPPVVATVGYNKALGNGWEVIMANTAPISSRYHAIAVCAPGSAAASVRFSARSQDQTVAQQIAAMKAALNGRH
jgi:hypothetical protein